MQTFKLIPYPSTQIPNISITGELERIENHLSIHYVVQGDIENILLPKSSLSSRQDDLWKATCFEFFFALPDSPEYWEVNMSPSSAWNVYRMDAYRRIGFREETAIEQLPFEFQKVDDKYLLSVSMDLTQILQEGQNIQVSITAIIQTQGGNETYWALVHPGAQADFHLRDSFIISL